MGTEAKLVQVSRDGIDYVTLPGSTAEISQEGAELENTIFGQKFGSTFTGIIDWSFSGNAWLRQQAGYEVSLKRTGDAVAFTDEPLAVEDGLIYRIVDEDKSFWDYTATVTVEDNGIAVDAEDIKVIDYIMGRVTFVDGYSAAGPITASGDYLPVSEFANANSMTLTQSADTIETGSFETVKANGGFQNYAATLLTASMDLEGFYREDNDFYSILSGRADILVEVDFAGDGQTLARGVFKVSSDSQSGDVGGDEVESISLSLSVPDDVTPFSWYFGPLTTAPEGAQIILESWLNREDVYVRYLPKGADLRGFEGQVVVTDASITAAVDSMVEISFEGQGNGVLTAINVSTA
jgi:hypothetical protein